MTAPDWWTDAAVKTIYGIRLTGTGERWDAPGIKAALAKLLDQCDPADAIAAMAQGAANPKLRTPAAVATPGPHWPEHAKPTPKVWTPCPEHPSRPLIGCDCQRIQREHAVPAPPDLKARIRAEAEAARHQRETERQEAIS